MKFKNAVKRYFPVAGVVAGSLVATTASAAIDVTAATTAIGTDGTTAISAIGGAIIGLAGLSVVFKWVKGAIFG